MKEKLKEKDEEVKNKVIKEISNSKRKTEGNC